MASPHIASRMASVQPFQVMELMGRAQALEAQGRDIVHLEVGEPDFDSPPGVIAAGIEALERGDTHYTVARGLPELRESIAAWYEGQFGLSVDPARIMVTPGASGALHLVTGVLTEPGHNLLMADPGYPCNRNFVRLFEGEARTIAVGPESAYQLDADRIRAHWDEKTCGALISTPSNPTGTRVSARALGEIDQLIQARAGSLIVDEIYQHLVYGAKPETALALGEHVFVVNSFSKYFGMTGWRLGWVVAPEMAIREMEKLAQNIFLAPSTLAQRAALACFEPDTLDVLEQRREAFRERRDFLLPALKDLGFGVPVEPEGAFYIYADCSRFGTDAYSLCGRLLEEAGVACTPGLDFGTHQSGGHIRFAYTVGLDRLAEGVDRMARWIRAET
ncbi:MAG: pyridoxal phosphate-dependent aminotransferase [Gammaproteobacteria bacterium]